MTTWRQNESFRRMDPKKQNMIEQLADSLEGRKLTEAVPLITKWKEQMQRENIVFTPEENQLLTEIFSEQLTPAQRRQFEYLKRFITPNSL